MPNHQRKFVIDIKFMSKGVEDFKYLLTATRKITNFVISMPIKTREARAIAEALIHRDI